MNTKKMKAIISTKYGSPKILKLKEVNKPIPKDNEVLVKIHSASITTAETMMRTGYPLIGRLFMGLTKPKYPISGTGFAGTIEAVGKKVKRFSVRDKVFGESIKTFGTYAEYVCIEEDGIIDIKPENLSYDEVAVIGDGYITSLNFLKNLANIRPRQSILINGASGSLGTAAVQLAKQFGAIVTGVCSARNVEMVKSLGADFVIDYTKVDFTENDITYDIIYDTVGKSSFKKCKNSLTKKGIYMSPVLDFLLFSQVARTSVIGNKKAMFSATGMLPVQEIQKLLQEVKELFVHGKLKPIIHKRYPLEEIPDGHRYIEKGHKIGNIVQVGCAI